MCFPRALCKNKILIAWGNGEPKNFVGSMRDLIVVREKNLLKLSKLMQELFHVTHPS